LDEAHEDNESDDGGDTEEGERLVINELQEDSADFGIEMNNIPEETGESRMQTFAIPKLLSDDEYLALITKLNEKQKRILLNVTNVIKTEPESQNLVFVSGAAGVGKAVLISASTQSLCRHLVHQIENDPEDLCVMLLAAAGRAAYNIEGTTIHQAFQFGFTLQNELARTLKLTCEARSSLYSKYRHIKMIIIDEVPLVGSNMLQAINRALQDIFGNNLPSGGLSVFVFGKLNQLKPVSDKWVFQKMVNVTMPDLWQLFRKYKITEIMRQKEDKLFATALSNLAIGATTEEDIDLFRSRELSKLNLQPTDVMNAGGEALFLQK